jgi:hypothetical protein
MKTGNYDVLNVEGGRPVKMWTQGVVVDDAAKAQLINAAQMPFIYKWIAVMPDVHAGKGIAFGLKYQANDKWAFSPRYEYYNDGDGFSTGLDQNLQEITLTGEYKTPVGLLARFEFRSDFSNKEFFVKWKRLVRQHGNYDSGAARCDQSPAGIHLMHS